MSAHGLDHAVAVDPCGETGAKRDDQGSLIDRGVERTFGKPRIDDDGHGIVEWGNGIGHQHGHNSFGGHGHGLGRCVCPNPIDAVDRHPTGQHRRRKGNRSPHGERARELEDDHGEARSPQAPYHTGSDVSATPYDDEVLP
jgi:hypothetical protein